MDMLSIRKVRLHGMKDSRWMTKDKITQYKGLINLFKRDKKISNSDKSVASKKDTRALAMLKKAIATDRERLDNALYGDKQIIRNTLLDDRRIKMAYERLEPEVIVEHIQQQKFNSRKKMDLMQFEKLQKSQRLVNVKLAHAELLDRLTYEQPGSFPVERQCREYTSHVQDAILKKEAAIVVNESYKKIISVMKKDQIYFDQILHCLKQDARKQAKCMYDTIVLGQLAIEYLDDRREDFKELEAAVHCDMTLRKQTVKSTRQVVQSLSKNIKFYIRRDSDINLPSHLFVNTNADIQQEVDQTCEILDRFKEAFNVNYYLELFDCLKEQHRQKERLRFLTDRTLKGRDSLHNRLNHASLMHTEMVNSVCDGTANYIEEKRSLLDSINYAEFRKSEARKRKETISTLLTNVKISLQQMEQICKVVKDHKEKRAFIKPPSIEKSVNIKGARQQFSARSKNNYDHLIKDVIDIKEDCDEIISILTPKFTTLMQSASDVVFDERTRALADLQLQKMTSKRTPSVLREVQGEVESLVEGVVMEDFGVPTRTDIKAQSKEIVAMCTASDDFGLEKGKK